MAHVPLARREPIQREVLQPRVPTALPEPTLVQLLARARLALPTPIQQQKRLHVLLVRQVPHPQRALPLVRHVAMA